MKRSSSLSLRAIGALGVAVGLALAAATAFAYVRSVTEKDHVPVYWPSSCAWAPH